MTPTERRLRSGFPGFRKPEATQPEVAIMSKTKSTQKKHVAVVISLPKKYITLLERKAAELNISTNELAIRILDYQVHKDLKEARTAEK